MFSKDDKSGPPGTPFFSSLTGKLIFLYTAASAGILVLCGSILYWEFTRSVQREAQQFLSESVEEVRIILRDRPDNLDLLRFEVESETSSYGVYKHYIRVLDEQERVIVETPGMGGLIPPVSFPHPSNAAGDDGDGIFWTSSEKQAYLLKTSWAPVGKSGPGRRLLQVALDISPEKAMVERYRTFLILVILIGVGCSAGAGVVVTQKGLKPLQAIAQVTKRVTANQLHDRIDQAGWPRELKTVAASFDAMLGRLEDSFVRLSQFSDDLAHELRTPINNLRGETEVSLTRVRTPDEYREVLTSHLEEYERLSHMIDSLLFLARIDNAETRLERSMLDGRKEIEMVREYHDAVAQEKEIEVTCQGWALLAADPALFRRAVSNLLSNAIKYTPSRGTIQISIRRLSDQRVEVSISDSGCGIAPEHLSRVFDRFYRVDGCADKSEQGIGLGLPIVKSIMDLHGGEIKIASRPAEGTTVTLLFPTLN
jgi:two-component system heavy metal sensor histidine kinase CusS